MYYLSFPIGKPPLFCGTRVNDDKLRVATSIYVVHAARTRSAHFFEPVREVRCYTTNKLV